MRTTRVPALLLALALTAACAGDDADTAPDDDAGASGTTEDVEVDEPDDADSGPADDATDDDGADDDAPDDDATADVDGQALAGGGVQMNVPEDWIVLDDASDFDEAAVAEAADALGIPPEQLEAQFEQIEALALAPEEDAGFTDNVNITIVPGETELIDEDRLRTDYESIGAEVTTVEDRDTPLGEGVTAEYVLDAGTTVHGALLFVVVDDRLVNVTVSAGQEGAAGRILDDLITTLGAAG